MNIEMPLGVGMIQQWLRALEPGPFLHSLRVAGVHFIEMYLSLRLWEQREQWLNTAMSEGLFFTFHGPYHGPYELPFFEAKGENTTRNLFIETFDKAALMVQKAGGRSRINLHSAMSQTLGREELMARTLEFLTWLIPQRDSRGWPFDFVLELLPRSPDKVRIGEDIAELICILNEVGDGLKGFCWDFGHYRRNELTGHRNPLETEFLEKVRHMHIHDIKSTDLEFDHCPLIFDEVPYVEYLHTIPHRDVFLVLEMNYQHTQSCGDPEAELQASIRKLQRAREALL